MPTDPPTAFDISDLVESVKDEFQDRENRDQWRDALYWGDNPIEHPSHIDFEAVHTKTGTAVVQNLIGILDEYPNVRAHTTSLEEKKVRRTTKIEDYLNPLWPALEDDSDADTFSLLKEDQIRLGRSYDELLFAPHFRSSKARGYPERNGMDETEWKAKHYDPWVIGQRLPVLWRHLPARGTFIWHDDDGPSEALIVEERRISDLLSRYPEKLNALRNLKDTRFFKGTDHVFKCSHWTRDWYTCWVSDTRTTLSFPENVTSSDLSAPMTVRRTTPQGIFGLNVLDGEVADQYPNIYGYVPVFETSGITSSDARSGRRQLSIMDHMLPLLIYLDRLVSQKGTAIRVWAWPTPFLKNLGVNGQLIGEQPKLADDGRPIPLEYEPGQMFTLLPGEDIGWLIAPTTGADVDEQIAFVMRQADQLGIPSSIFDASSVNSSNGYLYNSILNATRSKWSMIPRHIKRAHKQRCYAALKMVELYGEPLSVYKKGDGMSEAPEWFTIAPSDVKDAYYQIDVKFEDHLPMDDAADMQMFIQSTTPTGPAGPAMSHMTARERFLRINDPDREEDRLLIQEFRNSEPAKNFRITKAAEQAGYLLDDEEMGTPQEEFGNMDMTGMPGGLQQAVGAPAVMGGQNGAMSEPYMPGMNRPMTPPPPNLGAPPPNTGVRSPKNQYRGKPVRKGGRAPGQSRKPPAQPRPAG